jgi:uncharacterized protein (DUF1800 family)
MSNSKQVKHLWVRAGFGMRFEDFNEYGNSSINHVVKHLLKGESTSTAISAVPNSNDYEALIKGDIMARKMFLQNQKQQEKDLNLAWINQMSATDAPLLEKMTFFWHNHFACRTNNAQFAQQLNNIQRSNALGNFRTLLFQVAESPAMLQFLNNQQNQKGHPNENFARELMELFTIGRGNYTETDIKESARAFTGYGFNRTGEFVNRKFFHDDGIKTFMGKTGNFTGEDIMNMILERKETAHFISNKLYKYFVNETPDPEHVNAMANVFYKADYEIKPLLEYIFTADWFYDDKNTGNLIKSPIELLVGLNRQFYISYKQADVLLQFQHVLGQVLFYPPNVAGWPGGKNWIDSSSLMYRLKIPSILLNSGLIDFNGKADPEDEAYIAAVRNQQQMVATRVQAVPDWNKFFQYVPKSMGKTAIAQFMLEPKPGNTLINSINQATDIKTMVIELVSTPEYQLC